MRGGGMDMQLAELAAEGEMLLRRDMLVAEEDHEVLGKRAVDFVHRPIGQRAREIDPRYFRADDRGQLFDADRFVGLFLARRMAVARTFFAGERAHAASSDKGFCRIVARMGPRVTPSAHPRINSAQSGNGRATCEEPRISLALHPGYDSVRSSW